MMTKSLSNTSGKKLIKIIQNLGKKLKCIYFLLGLQKIIHPTQKNMKFLNYVPTVRGIALRYGVAGPAFRSDGVTILIPKLKRIRYYNQMPGPDSHQS
jgi:hypothetical protein